MANALKCDRCGNYFDYEPNVKNFIAFGHKDIIVGKNKPVKDICPSCMEQFMKWFEKPDIDGTDCADRSNGVTSSEVEYKDPCKSCFSGTPCEQCDYGYCSEEDKKKRWLENHKKKEENE